MGEVLAPASEVADIQIDAVVFRIAHAKFLNPGSASKASGLVTSVWP